MVIFQGLSQIADGLYGLRKTADDDREFVNACSAMLSDEGNTITYTPEELLAELDEEDDE
jgi:hypothetical protein